MRSLSIIVLAVSALAAPAFAQTVAPAGPGNAQGPAPINYYGSSGSQTEQIYAGSNFSGPTLINGISFRAYPGAAPSGFFSNSVSVSNITITGSTSQVSANEASGVQPSATFASNLGASVTTLFTGPLTLTTAATGVGAQPFDYTINFMTPYLYNPALGSLVLDFIIPNGATVSGSGFGFLTFDTANTLNDGVASVVNLASGSGTTGTVGTSAAITRFNTSAIGAVPEPATWATMVVGFGLMGAAMRRRRRFAMSAA